MSKTKAQIASDKVYKKGLVIAIVEINNKLYKNKKVENKVNYDNLMKKKIPDLEIMFDNYVELNKQ